MEGHATEEHAQGATSGLEHHPCFEGDCWFYHPITCHCLCGDNQECLDNCIDPPPAPPEHIASAGELPNASNGVFFTRYLPDIWFGVRSGTLDPIRLAKTYRNVEFNAERGALQVIGCDDRVVAHIPLSRAALAALGATGE